MGGGVQHASAEGWVQGLADTTMVHVDTATGKQYVCCLQTCAYMDIKCDVCALRWHSYALFAWCTAWPWSQCMGCVHAPNPLQARTTLTYCRRCVFHKLILSETREDTALAHTRIAH